VLFVGDIGRGGIFAQLLGTLDLLKPEERALVSGLIANRFRGDQCLFDVGRAILEQRPGLAVLATLPYHEDLPVAPEDSQ
jgi:adenosylcobyric acid synthase